MKYLLGFLGALISGVIFLILIDNDFLSGWLSAIVYYTIVEIFRDYKFLKAGNKN